ncbi:hypothetical protein, partial [Xanthovirga aplysinae]|uniref:hypothetical protein n=1 Tax=Xanthovirga aplysinae TaxID=2529853 RepID=UPI001656E576
RAKNNIDWTGWSKLYHSNNSNNLGVDWAADALTVNSASIGSGETYSYGVLDIKGKYAPGDHGSHLHIHTDRNPTGMFLSSYHESLGYISTGGHKYNGSDYLATFDKSTILQMNEGEFNFFSDVNLAKGELFTATKRFFINQQKVHAFVDVEFDQDLTVEGKSIFGSDVTINGRYESSLKITNGGINASTLESSSWARGITWFDDLSQVSDADARAGVGVLASNRDLERLYLAFGPNPWQSANGIFVLPDNKTGINVINPTEALEVTGNIKATGSGIFGTDGMFTNNSVALANLSPSNLRFQLFNDSSYDIISIFGGGTKTIRFDDGNLRFWSGDFGTTMTLDNETGNVAIGTNSPTEDKLTVGGNLKVSGSAEFELDVKTDGSLFSSNPLNKQANVALNWSENVARIRVGGMGEGAGNGFDIQQSGNKSLLKLTVEEALFSGNIKTSGSAEFGNDISVNGNTVWHEGNDGAGSTLDADQVDGFHRNSKYGVGVTRDFVIYGKEDEFYPVVLTRSPESTPFVTDFTIYRSYSEQAPTSWNNSTHKGSLSLDVSVRYGGWGGYTSDYTVNYFGEQYSRICAGLKHTSHTMQFVIWLRGGGLDGAAYHLKSPSNIDVTVYDYSQPAEGYLVFDNEEDDKKVYEKKISFVDRDLNLGSQIFEKMPIRGSGKTINGHIDVGTLWGSSNSNNALADWSAKDLSVSGSAELEGSLTTQEFLFSQGTFQESDIRSKEDICC